MARGVRFHGSYSYPCMCQLVWGDSSIMIYAIQVEEDWRRPNLGRRTRKRSGLRLDNGRASRSKVGY